jgi:hypothetical protein
MSDVRYLVSIDLGTSQTLLAYFDQQHPELGVHLLPIPQSVALGQQQALNYLPSLRYQWDAKTVAEHATNTDPFGSQDPLLIHAYFGPLAEQLGAQTQGHLISSAKSWLSQQHFDPSQPILPWAAASGVSKLSAIEASASYLRYLLLAWQQQHPHFPLAQQQVVITLPASFDDVARLYTQQAAERAGFTQVQFLEEPQAAFYDWYAHHQADLLTQLANIDLVLVCDIGGGTSDFSLIRVEPADRTNPLDLQPISLQRIAVSQHLLLGGDNIDAALAQQLLQKLRREGQVQKLSKGRLQQWRLACRRAKEQLLSDDQLTHVNVTLLGAGTRLIGDSFTEVLTRDTLMQLIANGFFPLTDTSMSASTDPVAAQSEPVRSTPQLTPALAEISLAYAQDPAITRHLHEFLAVHQIDPRTRLALLCNGGVLISEQVQSLLMQALQPIFKWPILRLHNPRPQQAVALGGIQYLRALRGVFAPIRALVPRNYFLQIAAGEQMMLLCVLPKGAALGEVLRVPEQSFVLQVGETVRFELLMDQGQQTCRIGELRAGQRHQYQQLPALQLPLRSQTGLCERAVYLQASANALGNLQLQCVTLQAPIECWDLSFDLKPQAAAKLVLPLALQNCLAACFGAKTGIQDGQAPIKSLKKNLEKTWGVKTQWSIEQLRALADALLDYAKARRRSVLHEQVWWQWLGFALRPGFGFVQDEQRMQSLLALQAAGIQYQQDAQVWREWWLAWRRVSGGLSPAAQQQFFQASYKAHALTLSQFSIEQLECFASFEYLTLDDRVRLATEIWLRLQQTPKITALWWALGRIGSPYCLYADSAQPLPLTLIEPWLQQLLTRDWQQQPLIAFTAVQLVQTNVAPALREAIEQKMRVSKCPPSWLLVLAGEVAQDQQLYQRVLGDSLPLGLALDQNHV